MELVCLDTNICIWAIKGQSSIGQEPNIIKAKYLLSSLIDRKAEIIIPSVVVAELLEYIPVGEHISFINRIDRGPFSIKAFDAMAALEYGRLKAVLEGPRDKQKVDRMLVATARAVNAQAIYSEDRHIRSIAERFIEVRELPTPPPEQLKLPS